MFNLERREIVLVLALTSLLIAGIALRVYTRSHTVTVFERVPLDPSLTGTAMTAEDTARVNINEAGIEELMKLKGIGKVLATRIVEYRSTRGQFTTSDDIMKVKGVNRKLLDRIKDYIETQ